MTLFSALGKIEKVVHLDAKKHVDSGDAIKPRERGNEMVITRFESVDYAFSQVGARFYVIVRALDDFLALIKNEPERYKYIIPYDPKGYSPANAGGVSDSWSQDYFEIFPDEKKLLFNTVVKDYVYAAMNKSVFPDCCIQIQSTPNLMPGGNLLLGKWNDSYLITSVKTNNEESDAETMRLLSERFSMKDNCINLAIEVDTDLSSVFYHVDMFLTIVGRVNGELYEDKEILLLARAESDNKDIARRVNDILDNIEQHLYAEGKRLDIPFKIIRITTPVFEDSGQAIGLSMNNCIVENYELNGKRKINLLVPDFRISIDTHIHACPDCIEKRTEMFQKFMKTPLVPALIKIESLLSGLLPQSLEEAARQLFDIYTPEITSQQLLDIYKGEVASLGIGPDNIIPVEYNFYDSAKNSHAGLHCLVKVIERTP